MASICFQYHRGCLPSVDWYLCSRLFTHSPLPNNRFYWCCSSAIWTFTRCCHWWCLKRFFCVLRQNIHKALQVLFTYFTFFVIRCLWEIGSKKSNTNCTSSFERLCLSKLPALAPWISEIHSTSSQTNIHFKERDTIWCYFLLGHECECRLHITINLRTTWVFTSFVCCLFVCAQQLLCSTMSCFWGLGIGCMVEYFSNDVEKLVHAFYPLFKRWVQLDYHNLKKLSDLSISIRRCFLWA